MPFYVNAQALLSDVRLRLDALGERSSALVVEGNDDKRLFYSHIAVDVDIVPAGGKKLLRSALQSILEQDKGRMLFLTDCDYDVAAGTLHGGPDVVITATCDVESDLINLGILEKLAVEVVPLRSIEAKDGAARIAAEIQSHAELIALALGRIRMAAQPLGVDLELEDIDLNKYWDRKRGRFLSDKLDQVIWERLTKETNISREDWEERVNQSPSDLLLCHGKDLLKAVQLFFRILYKMDNKITVDMLNIMMRLAMDQPQFERWKVVQRIRQWESRYGRVLLTSAPA